MAAPRAKGNAWLTVRVIIRYQSERVTPESRMFLYGDPAWSDLDWVGTASGGLTTSPPVHPYTLPADAAGLERLDSCSWVATVRVLAGCPGMACRVRLDSAFNCGANHSIASPIFGQLSPTDRQHRPKSSSSSPPPMPAPPWPSWPLRAGRQWSSLRSAVFVFCRSRERTLLLILVVRLHAQAAQRPPRQRLELVKPARRY